MHIHTIYSDGEYTPNEIIEMAIDRDIDTIAITDHDTINGVKQINRNEEFIKNSGITIFNGVEISCKWDLGTMHVLGYDFDIENQELNEWFNILRTNRMNSTLSVMEQIKRDYGITFNYQDIIDMINKNNIGRPDLAKLCIKYGFCNTVDEAFNLYLNPAKEKVRGTNKKIEYQECFKLIKNSGGLVVLAHPKTLNLNDDDLNILLNQMKLQGLDGIEVYNSIHTEKDSQLYLEFARKYDLLISGGSDYHGPNVKPKVKLGTGINGNTKIKQLSLVYALRKRKGY